MRSPRIAGSRFARLSPAVVLDGLSRRHRRSPAGHASGGCRTCSFGAVPLGATQGDLTATAGFPQLAATAGVRAYQRPSRSISTIRRTSRLLAPLDGTCDHKSRREVDRVGSATRCGGSVRRLRPARRERAETRRAYRAGSVELAG
jgi:hypothetical protein